MHISAVMCILKFYLKNIKKYTNIFYFLHWQIARRNQPIFLAANVLTLFVGAAQKSDRSKERHNERAT